MGTAVDGERSIASVFHDVVGNLGRIVRAEVRLAKVEVTDELAFLGRKSGAAAKSIVAGIVLAQLAVGLLLLFVVRLLETSVAPWLAALLVGIGAGIVAIALLASGMKQLKGIKLVPPEALESSTGNGT
ncbi:MAG TPA: phage holin family protein [Gemmatimonadaceae bacterium]|nr:phage holin family protein [Gemmatimonadaceae bacterium]